jgi:hypothetical protein
MSAQGDHDLALLSPKPDATKAEAYFARGRGSEGGDLRCRKGLRSKNGLDVKEIVIFGAESSAAVKSILGRCWNECANARDHLCLACRHAEPDWL